MFNVPDGNNFICASCSFIHGFYLNIVTLKPKLNNKTHSSEYNSEILEKADFHFYFTKNARTVVSDMTNASTKVAEYFSEDAEQVNCQMQHLNSAVKYGFDLLEIKISTIAVDENGLPIKLSN